MDVFQLFGKIAIENSDAVNALKETGNEGQKAESKLGKAFKAVGKGAVAVGKTIATGMAVGATAVTALVTKSIQSYADYEQLVGGVETLFKDSAEKVQQYAANAYKTAGLSANEYMETVTSFSASLLQSLEGDTNAAAEKANMAITDMSDNANKMGTDMSLIQNAYQGFAKANYTMLDNLKLGYGGTKEEMARLLADAQAISGIEYDISSYADIVDAIHVIQTEMGITGTTAKEASSTISGSIASMKASWQNLLTAISSDDLPFDTYVNNFVDSVTTVADNLMPRIEIALGGVVKLIDKLAPVIIERMPSLFATLLPAIIDGATAMIDSLANALPGMLEAITGVLPTLVSGITKVFNTLTKQIPKILGQVLGSINGMIPQLVKSLVGVITTVVNEIPNILGVLVTYIPQTIELLVEALLENLPILIEGLVAMLNELINQLPTIIDVLLTMVTSIFTMLMEQLPVILPLLLEAVVNLITMLIEQIPAILPLIVDACLVIISLLQEQLPVLIPMLVEALVSIVYMLIEQLPVIMPMLIEACITIVMAIVEALPTILMALINALPTILQAVWDAIVMVFKGLPDWFGQLLGGVADIFRGLWDAICEIFAPVGEWFSENFGDAWDSVVIIWNNVKPYFEGLWEGIKAAVSILWTVLKTGFKNAWEGIKLVFSVAVDFFKTIWENIKLVFSVVKNVLTGNFKDAWEGIKKIFSNWGSFFSGLWDKVKNTFSKIGTNIGDAISKSVKAGINGVIGMIEGVINTGINLINGAIGLINKLPGVSVGKIKELSLPRLAKGGVVDEPTPAIFGEDGAEAVVPLENNTGWMRKVASQIHQHMVDIRGDLNGAVSFDGISDILHDEIGSGIANVHSMLVDIHDLLVAFFPDALNAMGQTMVLDTGVLVAQTASAMNEELGRIAIQKGRGR